MAILGNQDEIHRKAINKGMKAIARLGVNVAKDPHRLNYHFMSPAAWINDPNGLIYFRGEYHIFYQIHPFSSENGLKHWGHAKSKDLIRWVHLPLALAPTEKFEEHGCFSGTAVNDKDQMTLIYTGNVVSFNEKSQVQCVAVSVDGITFRKYDENPVVRDVPPEGSVDFRDPKVWLHDNVWYMAVGSGKDEKGNVLLYQSDDLLKWDYIGKMFESQSAEQGIIWNCPDFFSIGEKDVLVVSPAVFQGNLHTVRKSIYFIGKMDYQTGKFLPEDDGDIDLGFDFYAPQTLTDDKGRIILFGWMDMWFNDMPTKAYGWAGAMTIPREVFLLQDGKLGFRPAEELKNLRINHQFKHSFTLDHENDALSIIEGDSLEIVVEFELESCLAESFGIKLRHSYNQGTIISYQPKSHDLIVDRSNSTKNLENVSSYKISPLLDNTLHLHIFLDRSSLELFTNQGSSVITKRIYPDPSALGVEMFAIGGSVKVRSLDVWELDSIW